MFPNSLDSYEQVSVREATIKLALCLLSCHEHQPKLYKSKGTPANEGVGEVCQHIPGRP